jgi:uncharacterized protein YsxB (DUF464 family)
MIHVDIRRKPGSFISSFKVTGHADAQQDHMDYDIVCAAVSAITLTAAFGLQDVLRKEGTYDSSSGYLLVDIGTQGDKETEAVIQTMIRGLQEVSRHYPGRIQFKEEHTRG